MGTSKNTAVRVVDHDEGIIEGLAIPFGGPLEGLDFYGTAFTKNTDFNFDWFAERPVLYDHGTDIKVGAGVIGRQISYEETELGIWARVQIDRANDYAEMILELTEQGLMGFSSGSLGRHVTVDAKGEILTWPWIELSITPTPANPYAMISPGATVDAMRAAGITDIHPVAIRALSGAEQETGTSLGRLIRRFRDQNEMDNATLADATGIPLGGLVSIMSGAMVCPR